MSSAGRANPDEAAPRNRDAEASPPEQEGEEARPEGDEAEGELPAGITEREVEDIEEHSRLRVPVIYEIVRREGETEMERPAISLWWSGLAAGLSISFSLLGQGVLANALPDTAWRPLVTGFGYCFGFLLVVLARQQLFTETTLTVVLPVIASFTLAKFRSLLRIWGIVFVANLTGAFCAALFWNFSPALVPGLREAMLGVAQQMMASEPIGMFFRAIPAGFLIAAMVWLIPSAEGAQFHVITFVTYLITVGGFTHIVAGSVDVFMLLVAGQIGLGHMLLDFTVPVLLGNVIGGTGLFALIAYAQVMREM